MPTMASTTPTEDEEGHIRILKHELHAMPFEEILKHWNACFELRQKSYNDLCDPKSKKHLITLWPMFKDPIGYRLVSFIQDVFMLEFMEININNL